MNMNDFRSRPPSGAGAEPSRMLGLMLSCTVLFLAPAHAQNGSDEDPRVQIEDNRALISEWAKTERLISEEKRDRRRALALLDERIELLKSEIAATQEKIADVQEELDKNKPKREELRTAQGKLNEAKGTFRELIGPLEQRVRRLVTKFPAPLLEPLKKANLVDRLPESEQEAKEVAVGNRLEAVLGILNQANKFNASVSSHSEVRTFEEGKSLLVQTLYFGIGHAYYASDSGRVAGIGKATAEGWSWMPMNERGEQIAQAIQIVKDDARARYVLLPIQLDTE